MPDLHARRLVHANRSFESYDYGDRIIMATGDWLRVPKTQKWTRSVSTAAVVDGVRRPVINGHFTVEFASAYSSMVIASAATVDGGN